ncbi:MAG: 30S ribosomal protein S4e [Thermoplasmataceae archaeon]
MITKSKRQTIPRVIQIPRKTFFWGVSAVPGGHRKDESIPMLHILRDYLKIGDKEREITRILNDGQVLVDGKKIKQRRYAAGFMDIISIPSMKKHYRILYDMRGKLRPYEEKEASAQVKLKKVKGKYTTEGGKIQLLLHDGQNFITSDSTIRPGDVVAVHVPDKKIESVIKLQPGTRAFLTGGSHVGTQAVIKNIEISKSSGSNLIHMEEGFSTISDYVFPIAGGKFSYQVPEKAGDE